MVNENTKRIRGMDGLEYERIKGCEKGRERGSQPTLLP